jgi:hypothetical protein
MRGLLGFLFLVGLVLAYWQWVLAATHAASTATIRLHSR